ncbi:MAG: hypothetical protein HC912_10910 [Saprospiraceae bacterium]|nr:hypothetical protein [Saprospiraceae bacterium]
MLPKQGNAEEDNCLKTFLKNIFLFIKTIHEAIGFLNSAEKNSGIQSS